jgi:hypothetical protein
MRRLSILVIIVLATSACEKRLPLPDGNKIGISVNMLGNNIDAPEVKINLTTPLDKTDSFPPVSNANVIIYAPNDTGRLIYNGFTKSYSIDTNIFRLKAGKIYKLQVQAPGFPLATSSLIMPPALNLSGAVFKDSIGIDGSGFPIGGVNFPLRDQAGVRNYYLLNFYTWNSNLAQWEDAGFNFVDADIDGAAEKNKNGSVLLNDALFDGQSREIRLYAPFGFAGQTPKFKIAVRSLEQNYYYYLRSVENYAPASGIFSEPAQVLSNITGAVGIFAGSTVSEFIIN